MNKDNDPPLILLVEDNETLRFLVSKQMKKLGLKVDFATDGAEAVEMAKCGYDLILMDIGLGSGPDGFEVTKQIKIQSTINKSTPIVAVTSHEGEDYKEKAREVGMERYFNKPFTAEDAKNIVEYIKNK